jgi:8-oxo-dGTP pyrophosphatase MutT (NUDIX family)
MNIGVYGILRKENKILFVKNDTHWILPGGKPHDEENSYMCLEREFKEELSGTEINIKKFYGFFQGKTSNSKKDLGAHVYFCDLVGELGKPSSEIKDSSWIGKEYFFNYNVYPLNKDIFESLVKDKYLK